MNRKRRSAIEPATTALSSLGDLLRQRGVTTTAAPAAVSEPEPIAPAPAAFTIHGGSKIVLRRERKGHGGKMVTVVEGLALPADQLEELVRQLRKALGSGARVNGDRVLIQGDVGHAVENWLRAHGATRVSRGN